jgi:DNA-binding NtrC family response regulator
MASGEVITDEWLPSDPPAGLGGPAAAPSSREAAAGAGGSAITIKLGTSMADAERQLILATLAHFNNHKERTAAVLGVSLKTLYNRLKEYAADKVDGDEALEG